LAGPKNWVMSFQIHAISDEILTGVRASGRDVSGNPVEPAVATGGEPLRCCLRDARPGEDLIQIGRAHV